ncbi:MAG: tRNA adenosine(34) deaminase TadA [Acidaminococcaceae bacterium]|jgi:tRNA(adenine34) deaminase|nr:tRNA adenosine(34) deaminase TadA [Acidaminococcaceae bacterium]
MHKDEEFMLLALAEAQKAAQLGEIPVGAVIVQNGVVLASSYNQRETEHDATAHAEVLAIREACRHMKSWRLAEATIYVTLEPCPMCAGAIWNARMQRVVYGAVDSRAGAAESLFNVINNKYLNHQCQVTAGVCAEKCKKILQDFFEKRR